MLAEGTAAVTVGGSAGSSTGGRGRERTGLGDRRIGVTGRGKGKHQIGQSERWHVANGIVSSYVFSIFQEFRHFSLFVVRNSSLSRMFDAEILLYILSKLATMTRLSALIVVIAPTTRLCETNNWQFLMPVICGGLVCSQ